MAVEAQEDGNKIIVFDLVELGVDPSNWHRLASSVKARNSITAVYVGDAYVQRGKRPGVENGKFVVIPDLTHTPAGKRDQVLTDLDESIAEAIAHRALNPDRRTKLKRLVKL